MTPERHLRACALEMERQHGEAAYLFSAMRADELEAEGAFEDARTWRAILSRIEGLEPRDGGRAQ